MSHISSVTTAPTVAWPRRRVLAAALGLTIAGVSLGATPVAARQLTSSTAVQVSSTIAVAPVTNLRAVSATRQAISVAWTASTTPNVEYRVVLNGYIRYISTTGTSAVLAGEPSYPGPGIISGTGPKKGNNTVTVQAVSTDPATLGSSSTLVQITVKV